MDTALTGHNVRSQPAPAPPAAAAGAGQAGGRAGGEADQREHLQPGERGHGRGGVECSCVAGTTAGVRDAPAEGQRGGGVGPDVPDHGVSPAAAAGPRLEHGGAADRRGGAGAADRGRGGRGGAHGGAGAGRRGGAAGRHVRAAAGAAPGRHGGAPEPLLHGVHDAEGGAGGRLHLHLQVAPLPLRPRQPRPPAGPPVAAVQQCPVFPHTTYIYLKSLHLL